jgi:hypothetical protein
MDLSNLGPEELVVLKSQIDSEMIHRSGKMMDDLDDLLNEVRTIRERIGLSKASTISRLFPVTEGSRRGRRRRKKVEVQSTEESPTV